MDTEEYAEHQRRWGGRCFTEKMRRGLVELDEFEEEELGIGALPPLEEDEEGYDEEEEEYE